MTVRRHPFPIYIGTTAERTAFSLPAESIGASFWDTDESAIYWWDGTQLVPSPFAGHTHLDHVSGLRLVWDSTTGFTVETGDAWIEGDESMLVVSSDITESGLSSLSASTWYYVYLYDNSGSADVEVSSTAPASPYHGYARSKTGDDTKRFIGCFLTDGSGNIRDFESYGTGGVVTMAYREATAASPFRVLNAAAKQTTAQNLNLSAVAPPGVTTDALFIMTMGNVIGRAELLLTLENNSAYRIAIMGSSPSATNQYPSITLWSPVNSSTPSIYWYNTAGTASTAQNYIDLFGFKIAR